MASAVCHQDYLERHFAYGGLRLRLSLTTKNTNLPDSELCSPELLLHTRKCVKKLPVNFIVNYYLFAGVSVPVSA